MSVTTRGPYHLYVGRLLSRCRALSSERLSRAAVLYRQQPFSIEDRINDLLSLAAANGRMPYFERWERDLRSYLARAIRFGSGVPDDQRASLRGEIDDIVAYFAPIMLTLMLLDLLGEAAWAPANAAFTAATGVMLFPKGFNPDYVQAWPG